MYNYGYRDYVPQTARFSTVDPIRDGSNWFAYCENEPVNFQDAWGLSASDPKNNLQIGQDLSNNNDWTNSMDDNQNLIDPKELDAFNLMNDIINNPDDYTIDVYERVALNSNIRKNEVFTHSLYAITKEDDITTLSYYGLDGTWQTNTETDVSSMNNPSEWEMVKKTPENGVNNQKTAKNIIGMIQAGEDSYFLLDHIMYSGPGQYNCNTALRKTLVKN